MADAPPNPDPIAPEDLDRLVDGALSGPERRALLDRAEAVPDGWRRCALAFLEAQCWREALTPFAERADDVDDRPIEPRRPRRAGPLLLASAASLAALAFAVGWSAGAGRWSAATIVANRAPEPSHVEPPGPAIAGREPSDPVPQAEADEAANEVRAVGLVQIPGAGGTGAGPIRLPVFAGPGLDENWLRGQPSFVPEDYRRRWQADGYRVEHQRRLVSVQFDEAGRYLAIPVDEVILREPGTVTY